MADVGLSLVSVFSFLDHSNETTRTKLHVAPLDDATANPQIAAGGAADLLGAALVLLTRLDYVKTSISATILQDAPVIPTEALAQREIAIRWTYTDTVTGKKYRFDVAAPVDAIVPTGSDDVNMAAAAVLAFKAVFDANAISEMGNPVSLLSGRVVGRRN